MVTPGHIYQLVTSGQIGGGLWGGGQTPGRGTDSGDKGRTPRRKGVPQGGRADSRRGPDSGEGGGLRGGDGLRVGGVLPGKGADFREEGRLQGRRAGPREEEQTPGRKGGLRRGPDSGEGADSELGAYFVEGGRLQGQGGLL